jgi:signal transduction histidine kinase
MKEHIYPSGMPLAEQDARDRVKELRSFYQSIVIYVLVNALLWTINLLTKPTQIWAIWPTLGWGSAMLIWGLTIHTRGSRGWFGRDWEERKVQEMLARENLRTVSSEKQLVQAQLRMLQAQIEPHFLFNTLANIQSLIARSPDKAQAMMDSFIAYLRQSLDASRAQEGTLAQEVLLLKNYLDLLKIRMGERLSYTLDVPQALAAMPLSPMLLQPIVENAVRHGLEPKVEGGRVDVMAERSAAGVRIEVRDNGLGFSPGAASGVGLSNLRERLKVLYDGKARLDVLDAQPGTRVVIELPAVNASAASMAAVVAGSVASSSL